MTIYAAARSSTRGGHAMATTEAVERDASHRTWAVDVPYRARDATRTQVFIAVGTSCGRATEDAGYGVAAGVLRGLP